MSLLFLILAVLIVLATLLPLSRQRHWLIRSLDFPRLQLAIAAATWLLAWFYLPHLDSTVQSLAALAVAASLAYQCYWIFPNTEMHRQEVERYEAHLDGPRSTIKLLNSNVLTSNRRCDLLLDQVHRHQPDILITLESDQWWQDRLDTLKDYPHRIACPLDNLYGMHVYSRLPLHDMRIEFLVEDDKPSMSATVELPDGDTLQLHVLHPAPPAPGENEESTERDVELLLLADALSDSKDRIIMAGDLNDVAWSATTRLFRQISGLLDLRIGRGLFNTFNANYWFARWPLDHFFVSSHFKVVDIQRLPHIGSDHFPLLLELALCDDVNQQSAVEDEELDEERLEDIMDSTVALNSQRPII